MKFILLVDGRVMDYKTKLELRNAGKVILDAINVTLNKWGGVDVLNDVGFAAFKLGQGKGVEKHIVLLDVEKIKEVIGVEPDAEYEYVLRHDYERLSSHNTFDEARRELHRVSDAVCGHDHYVQKQTMLFDDNVMVAVYQPSDPDYGFNVVLLTVVKERRI